MDPARRSVGPSVVAAEHKHGTPLAFSRAPPKENVALTSRFLQARDGNHHHHHRRLIRNWEVHLGLY